jgi:hypothetical protein
MDASLLDESALARRDEIIHEGGQAQSQDLGDDFRDSMDEAYGPEVPNVLRSFLLQDQDDIRLVKKVEVPASVEVERCNRCRDVRTYRFPEMFEEMSRESIWAGGFIPGHKANRLPYFLFSEGAIEGGQIMCQRIQFRPGEVTGARRGRIELAK